MAIEDVRKYLEKWDRASDILEFETSSATVELAAQALNVIPAKIAKSLSFKNGEGAMLIVAAGDAKTDNAKFKGEFGFKARMLDYDEVLTFTGHAVGGVCPFGLRDNINVYLDISLKRFDYVYPACGSSNSAIKLNLEELWEYSNSIKWVDVCKGWQEE